MNASSWTAQFKSPADLQRVAMLWGPKVAIAILTLAIAAEAALLITRQAPGVPALSADDDSAQAARRPARRNNASEIIAAHLFGAAAPSADGTAPKTSLQLILAGVLATDDPQKGQAILGPAANTAKLYATGQSLPGGAKLNAVYGDRVLIENNGAIEALYLPHSASPVSLTKPAALPPSGGQRLQSALQNNSSLLNGTIRMQAVFNQGKLSGYRVFPGRGGQAVFSQLGLRPGDLITAISGTPLDDANRANEILQTLGSADSATVTISRNGQSEDLTLNLSEVATAAENATPPAETADDGSTVEPGVIPPPPGGARAGGRPGGPRGPGAQNSTPNPSN